MYDSLPVIVVSAKTIYVAAEFISELIDKDVTEEVKPIEAEDTCDDRVWRICTKYYQADVRVAPRADAHPPEHLQAEAHLVYFDEEECRPGNAVATAERRLSGAPDAEVAVVVCRAPAVPAALEELCAQRQFERVALLEPAPIAPAEPFALTSGVQAVREALHAHVWPGLRLLAPSAQSAPPHDTDPGVEGMERFAALLEALGGGAAHVARLQPGTASRRAAAECLVAEFARAIGHDLEDLDALPE